MSTRQRHIIKRVILELKNLKKENAKASQLRFKDMFYKDILPLLEQYLDRLSPNETFYQIDKLELDLGQFSFDHLDEEILNAVNTELQTRLKSTISTEKLIATKKVKKDGPLAYREMELIHHFVQTGSLPWWYGEQQSNPIESILKDAIATEPQSLERYLLYLVNDTAKLKRLLNPLSSDSILQLITIIVPPSESKKLEQLLDHLLMTLSETASFNSWSDYRLKKWTSLHFLQTVFNHADLFAAKIGEMDNLQNLPAFWKTLFVRMSERQQVSYQQLVVELHQTKTISTQPVSSFFNRGIAQLYSTFSSDDKERSDVKSNYLEKGQQEKDQLEKDQQERGRQGEDQQEEYRLEKDQKEKGREEKDQQGKDQQEKGRQGEDQQEKYRLEKDQKEKGREEKYQQGKDQQEKGRQGEDQQEKYRLEKDQKEKDREEKYQREKGQQEKGRQGEDQQEKYRLERDQQEKGRKEKDQQENNQQEKGRKEKKQEEKDRQARKIERPAFEKSTKVEELYINNAGLAILWAYLPRFFELLNLTKGNQFVSVDTAHRAAGLLQFLVDGDPEPKEYLMGFNKVLCGLEWDEILGFGDPVTEQEAEESEQLVQAIILNAPILKKMSIDGFRGSFLLRKGRLKAVPGNWQLHVERQGYDIVLDQFPWSWKMIKLPWLESMVVVEW